MTKLIFIIFVWFFIVLSCYQAYLHIEKITNNDLKNFENVMFFLVTAIILSIAFLAEYLKK